MPERPVQLRPAWSSYLGSFVIGVSCLLLALLPGGAWGVPPAIWAVAAAGILGFAILSRYSWRYEIDDERLVAHYGLIARKQKSVRIRDLRDIEILQPWGDKMFGVGTLAFHTGAAEETPVIFWGIKGPAAWHDRIRKAMDRAGSQGA
jgi:uncharacterized membrane protein YdbT with pleckstrin-like domain